MITFAQKGDFKKTESFLKRASTINAMSILEKYARQGVSALSSATPKDTGFTAGSWSYEIEKTSTGFAVVWHNEHVEKGYANIALLLQYGHGTRNGGFVSGRDYINPAIRPILDKMANDAWLEVLKNG